MITTGTRTAIWRRRWAQATGVALAAAILGGGIAAGAIATSSPRAAVLQPAAHAAPPGTAESARPPKAAPVAKPAPRPAPPKPATSSLDSQYASAILAAGITASRDWIILTGHSLAQHWQQGYTAAWTDANILTSAGVYSSHLAPFDQITTRYYGVTPPAHGIQPQASPPVLSVTGYIGTRPGLISFSGDAGYVITGITWSSWGPDGAFGTGTSSLQGCVPNCAYGSETPVTTTISLSAPYGGQFTHITAVRNGQVTSGSTALITGAQRYSPAPPPAPVSGDPVAGTGTGTACTTIAGYYPGGLPGHRDLKDPSGFCVPDK